jgi:S-adenosyl methyltransferase
MAGEPGGLVCGWPGHPGGPPISALGCPIFSLEISVTSGPELSQHFGSGNASTGRVYNAYTGGKDNFEADRALAGQVVAIAPDAVRPTLPGSR